MLDTPVSGMRLLAAPSFCHAICRRIDMSLTRIGGLVAAVALMIATTVGTAADPKSDAKSGSALVGTWKCISAKYGGQEVNSPEGFTHVKHVTPTHFIWAIYGADGKVEDVLGGSIAIKGDQYVETPEYGTGTVLEQLKGKPQTFIWKVEGNKWHHTGKLSSGLAIEEVWERVEKK